MLVRPPPPAAHLGDWARGRLLRRPQRQRCRRAGGVAPLLGDLRSAELAQGRIRRGQRRRRALRGGGRRRGGRRQVWPWGDQRRAVPLRRALFLVFFVVLLISVCLLRAWHSKVYKDSTIRLLKVLQQQKPRSPM